MMVMSKVYHIGDVNDSIRPTKALSLKALRMSQIGARDACIGLVTCRRTE